ncbi:MAG: multicopper oxidase domain-containing protein, partial [Acidobacteriota bacterium]
MASDDTKTGLERRTFLRAGLIGAGAAAASTLPATAAPVPSCESTEPGDPACSCATTEAATPTPVDPNTAFETWNEPWVWRPSDWPGQQLDLHVVENQSPGINVGLGNPGSVIFSYGGNTPGPTIRMRGDEILFVKLRNLLGQNEGTTAIGPNPDAGSVVPWLGRAICELAAEDPANGVEPKPNSYSRDKAQCNLTNGASVTPGTFQEANYTVIPAKVRDDFCLGEHTNGVHAAHTTNLHTHGLHVRPDRNPNGTHSDNVILRVMPQADLTRREQDSEVAACEFLRKDTEIYFLRDDETAGQADYEYRLGDVMGDPNQPHPPGTHWYHPHSHGATHNQVASGMAGFLVVEGDVDEAVNHYFTGASDPDPTLKTGPFDYRERLMFMQRVNVGNESKDPNAADPNIRRAQVLPLVNGSNHPPVITMRPGAVERWRVINGSVDGRGYKHVMVLEGQYDVVTIVQDGQTLGDRLCKVDTKTGKVLNKCVGFGDIEPWNGPSPKQQLYQFAFDGITLVDQDGKYTLKDLAKQNAGTKNPLAKPAKGNPNVCMLEKLQSVWHSADSIRDTWVRPNEVYMGPANRTDLFFQAPRNGAGKVFTVLAKAAIIHADTPLQNFQKAVAQNPIPDQLIFGPTDIILAHIVVQGDPVDGRFDPEALRRALPVAPPYLQPVLPSELELTQVEKNAKPKAKKYRTRTIRYMGLGSEGFPLFIAPDKETAKFPKLNKLQYAASPEKDSPTKVFMSPNIRTMAIDGRKFSPNDPKRPRSFVIIDEAKDGCCAAEEWALFNESLTLWGNTVNTPLDERGPEPQGDPRSTDYKQPDYQWAAHYVSYPINRREGQEINSQNADFQCVSRAIDHPFHQHQNPFWVMRIEIPDQDGNLVNILPEPRWQDTVWIPRNGGRIIFRSRFPDFVGTWVNHCHILLHEDNGMMQVVQGTPFADEANYTTADQVAQGGLTPPDRTNGLYPPPSRDRQYQDSLAFVDPNHDSGQLFPLPSYFDKAGTLIRKMIPVPKLPEYGASTPARGIQPARRLPPHVETRSVS